MKTPIRIYDPPCSYHTEIVDGDGEWVTQEAICDTINSAAARIEELEEKLKTIEDILNEPLTEGERVIVDECYKESVAELKIRTEKEATE